MEFNFSMQDTSAAAAAIRSLQIQLKDLRSQNQKLNEDLHSSGKTNAALKESYEKQLESLRNDLLAKETAMKEDIVYLCQRVQFLEQDNLALINDGHNLKEQALEAKQNQRMIIMLKEEVQILNKKLQQKDVEIDLLKKRIDQLEGQEFSVKANESLLRSTENKPKQLADKIYDSQADMLDSELSQQKSEYREYLKNPNPSSNDWKNKVEQLRKSIESNSQELLRLRKDQYEQVRGYLDS